MKILQIVPSLSKSSGIMTVVYNWHKNIDTKKIQFDYLYFEDRRPINYKEEIKNIGGNYFVTPYPSLRNILKYIAFICKFFKKNRYDVIHSHLSGLNFFIYPIAKFYGVKNIIQHAHGTKWSNKFLSGLRNYILLHAVWLLIDRKVSCSQTVGNFWFKKNYTVINNGIEIENFRFNKEIRTKIRKELNVENNFVIGHVGRFEEEKNHVFLIDIFYEIYKQNKNSVLLLIGDGSLKKEIKSKVEKLNLLNKVVFTGTKNNTCDYYNAMDVFLLPSKQEGLPMTGLEAQTNGLPCFFSTEVPNNVIALSTSQRLSVKLQVYIWAKEILKYKNFIRIDKSNVVKNRGFDIKTTTKQIEEFYMNLK